MLWAPNRRVVVVTPPRIASGRMDEYPARMAGYAATERITRARPRFVGTGVGSDDATGPDRGRRTSPRRASESTCVRWTSVSSSACPRSREAWAQATFFLFDPNSWR